MIMLLAVCALMLVLALAVTFTYPTSAELQEVAQDKLPRLMQNRPIFDMLPVRSVDAHRLMWEQLDNFIGLQQIRGLDGEPGRVKRVGAKQYDMEPGTYGEFIHLAERELTTRRALGTFGQPIDISDLVMMAQDQLLQRRLDRIELIGWTLLTTGTFSVSNLDGTVMHTDTFSLQTFAAIVPWSTYATATPLADLRAIKLLHRGHSVTFGASSTLFVNQATINNLLLNTNAADLYGRRVAGLATLNNLRDLNTLLTADDLPNIAAYDETYFDEAGATQLFIPLHVGVLVGKRPAGQVVGEYRFTRNANNPDLGPGAYMKVLDRGDIHVPRTIEVHDGHNGGPVIYYPSAVVSLSGL